MNNRKDSRSPKVVTNEAEVAKVPGCKSRQLNRSNAPALLKEVKFQGRASVRSDSGFTTPDTFISLPKYERNTVGELTSASEALEAYIQQFEGRSKEKYDTRSFSSWIYPQTGVVSVDVPERMIADRKVNDDQDSNSLISWVNKIYKKELDRTCVPAYDTTSRKGIPIVSNSEIAKHVYAFDDKASIVSSLPSSLNTIGIDDVETVNTDVLVHNYSSGKVSTMKRQKGRSDGYSTWVDKAGDLKTNRLNESRTSTVSTLLQSGSKYNNHRTISHKVPRSQQKSDSRQQQDYIEFDDAESISTDLLLESSVYGHEPVNMGGNMHTPLYQDKKVKKILNDSKHKKKKHQPQNSILSRTIHGTEDGTLQIRNSSALEDSLIYPYQFGQSQFSHSSRKPRSTENVKKNLLAVPLPDRCPKGKTSQSSSVSRGGVGARERVAKNRRSPLSDKSPLVTKLNKEITRPNLSSRMSSSLNDLDALRVKERYGDERPVSSVSSTPSRYKPISLIANPRSPSNHLTSVQSYFSSRHGKSETSDSPVQGGTASKYDSNKLLVENLSHKTSGYLSGSPSFGDSRRPGQYVISDENSDSNTREVELTRKLSGVSDSSGNTEKIVRTSPTGIKYHSRSRTWHLQDRTQSPNGEDLLNTSAPSLGAINVINKRLEKQKIFKPSSSARSVSRRTGDKELEISGRSFSGMRYVPRSAHSSRSHGESYTKDQNSEIIVERWEGPYSTSYAITGDYASRSASEYEGDIEDVGEHLSKSRLDSLDHQPAVTLKKTSPTTSSSNWREFHHPGYYEELGKRIFDYRSSKTSAQEITKETGSKFSTALLSPNRPSPRQFLSSSPIETHPSHALTNVSRIFRENVKENKSLPLMSDTDSEDFSVNTELLLVQPPMPIVNASPSLSTVSDSDTICDSDSASTSYREHTITALSRSQGDGGSPSSRIRDINHNVSLSSNQPSRAEYPDVTSYDKLFMRTSRTPVEASQNTRAMEPLQNSILRSDQRLPSPAVELPTTSKDMMYTFIKDCINSAEQKNGLKTPILSKDSEMKLSGGHHPGPIEALKHMLLNLQNETTQGSFITDDAEGNLEQESVISIDERDDTSSLPGQQSLQRAYHHLERLKTLVHERSDK